MAYRQRTQSKPSAKHQLRIIGGQWRGRKLAIAEVKGLRPTGDRIRETVFNWLMHDITGACCLDLFAGSGALGFESLSRGASQVIMLEKHPLAAQKLAEHSNALQTNQATIIQQDSLQWLAQSNMKKAGVDIVFIDPPFVDNLWQTTINHLTNSQLLNERALIYIETPKAQALQIPTSWQLHRHKHSGQVTYQLFKAG